ncbi:MAG: acyl-CoA dehydrogenase family protein [Vicinamibacteria bacterium]|nr:acyl-CoA dehydrogenase family protein [Vicinamibacteria bacterium]
MSRNLYSDNPDLLHHVRGGVRWDRIVPLWEEGFTLEDGPRSTAEARELYEQSLEELGAFAAEKIEPRARAVDAHGVRFENGQVVQAPELLQNIEGLKRLGVMAPNLPRELGGFNFPFVVGAAMMEIVSRACTNTLLLHVFYQGPAVMVVRYGTPEQIERWTRPLAVGDISASVAITEPDAGSDIGRVATTAREEGGGWRVTGRKQFITNGCGDVCIVVARSEPGSQGLDGLSLFIVPRQAEGRDNYVVAKPESKYVIRGSATCELSFDGSQAELLGPRGAGFQQVLSFMNEARLAVAVQGLGLCEAATRAAKEYAERRVQMGKPIARHELVADLLLDMETETAAMRALIYDSAELFDIVEGLSRPKNAAVPGAAKALAAAKRALRERIPLVKWFGAERTLWVTRAAVQVHGGYGVVADYDVERHYRNALILPIYEGTSQIQALMSLKDQVKWLLQRPWSWATGCVSVDAPQDALGDGLREMAGEYERALKFTLRESLGVAGVLAALAGRGPQPAALSYALLQAERLCAMLSYTRAAESLARHAAASPRHRRLAERFVHRSLPLVRMHGEIVRSGDRDTLEA